MTSKAHGQWTSATLSQSRGELGAATVGTKILFAGGIDVFGFTKRVDIYDYSTNNWTTSQLSQSRMLTGSAVAINDKAFFGGGTAQGGVSDVVDIYDDNTGAWSVKKLSTGRTRISAAAVGNKVLFAGGVGNSDMHSSRVDIYDTNTDTWATAELAQARVSIGSATLNNKVYFAGGAQIHNGNWSYFNTIDIYDNSTNTWSVSALSQARSHVAVVAAGTKIFFAGGVAATGFSTVIDIYDYVTNSWTTAALSIPSAGVVANTAGNKVIFAGGSGDTGELVTIYDIVQDSWTTSTMPQGSSGFQSVSAGGKIYFAGFFSDRVLIYEVCTPEALTLSADISICKGSSTVLTASGASDYRWTPTESLSFITPSSATASPSVTTTYKVFGTDANNCESFSQVTVTIDPVITITGSTGICSGGSTVLTASGAQTYTWAPSTGLSATSGNTVTANPTQITTYTVTATDDNNCTNHKDITVTVHPLPIVTVSPSSPEICSGVATTITAQGALTYAWTPATGLSGTTGNTLQANPLQTTTYTVTGTDGNNCAGEKDVTVVVHSLPTITVDASSAKICPGVATPITAQGALTYTWTPAAGLSGTTGNTLQANPLKTTTYTVTGTDGNNCAGVKDHTVLVHSPPTITVDASPRSICDGATTTITAEGASSYTWTPAAGLSGTTGNTVQASPLKMTTYTVKGTGEHNCTATKNFTVLVHSLPTVTVNASSPTICEGATTTITAKGAVTYTWAPSTGLSGSTGNTLLANPTLTTDYTVIGIDSNKCQGKATVTLTVINIPKPVITASTTDGIEYVLASSTTSGNQWYKNGVMMAEATNDKIQVRSLGDYKVRVSQNGCQSDFSDIFSLVITSLEETPANENILLYPNPVDQILNIDWSGFDRGRVVEIRIIDLLGRTVSAHTLSNESTTIDVSELLSGPYILTATQGPMLQKKKFFKH